MSGRARKWRKLNSHWTNGDGSPTLRRFVTPAPHTARTLLVIDDNKSVRESLQFLLERRGYRVQVAENGPESIALASTHAFDGAMIDVNMPGMNGVAVCRALKAQAAEKGRSLAVWMMTGACTSELVKSAHEAGALAVLPKPFNLAELFRRLDDIFAPKSPPEADAAPGCG